MLNVGVVRIKPAAGRVDVIPPFGHGQGNNTDRRIGHGTDQRAIPVLDRQIVDHRPGDLGSGAGGVKFDQGGQAILRQQPFAHLCIIAAHTRPDDRPIHRQTRLHQPMQIPRLMGAVKIAQPDVYDARCQRTTVIGRAQNIRWHIGQGRVVENE